MIPTTKNQKLATNLQLYGIIDTTYLAGRSPDHIASQMIQGGVDLIQLRAKHSSVDEINFFLQLILSITRPNDIPLIVNDHPQIAADLDLDGVHLGQDDLSIGEARKIIGHGKWIGKSTHSFEQALEAQQEDVDYIGVGPIYPTATKPTYSAVGLDLIRQVSQQIHLPFFCIGGIKLENVTEVISMGARRIVVVSGILQSPDIIDYCRQLKKRLHPDFSKKK